MKNDRRGSLFVEAAMVFPLVVLIAAGALSITTDLYFALETQVEEHLSARESKRPQEAELVHNVDFALELIKGDDGG